MSNACARLIYRMPLVLVLCLHAGIAPGIAAADLASQIEFYIPPQQMAAALLKYSVQSGVQVTSSGDIVEDKLSTAVIGRFVARDALERLLAGSNLEYQVVDASTVAIRRAARVWAAEVGP